MVFITSLPPDAAFSRKGKMWTQEHELLALTVEKLEMRMSQLAVMWADKNSQGKIPPPIAITHPDRPEQPKAKKKVGPAGIAALFGGGRR